MDTLLTVLKSSPVLGIAGFWITWVFYVAGTHIVEHRDKLKHPVAKVFGYVTRGVLLPIYWAINVASSAFFLERPQAWNELLSARLPRLEPKSGVRGWTARQICDVLLNPFDHEGHC